MLIPQQETSADTAGVFKPLPWSNKQKMLLTWWLPGVSPYADRDLIIADGAIRSGKTVAGIDSFITWSLHSFKGQAFILAGRSMGALRRNVLRPAFQILQARGISYRDRRGATEPHLAIGENIYYYFGAATEQAQDWIQGLTAAGAFLDDAALFPWSFIMQAMGRCSVPGSKVWFNCNPRGPYHPIKTELIDRAAEKKILHLHFVMSDNPALTPERRAFFERMFVGLLRKRFIEGLWVLAEGAIYDMFDEALHVIPCPDGLPRSIVAVDHGTSAPCTFGRYRWSDGGPVWLQEEYYFDPQTSGRQKTDTQFADDLASFVGNDYPELIYVDEAAAGFILELRQRGFPVQGAKHSVIDGIRFVSNMLADVPGHGPCFLIDPSCEHTRKQYASYVWNSKAQERGEDQPIKQNDHCPDRDRYGLYSHWYKGDQPMIW